MDLANELLTASKKKDGRGMKVLEIFGDSPDVLEAIKTARRDRRLSYRSIAEVLNKSGVVVSEGAVQNYLRSQGIS
jgi:ribosome-binding protein aMBF1 (putative translation factor)